MAQTLTTTCDNCGRPADGDSVDHINHLACGHDLCEHCQRPKGGTQRPRYPEMWCRICKFVTRAGSETARARYNLYIQRPNGTDGGIETHYPNRRWAIAAAKQLQKRLRHGLVACVAEVHTERRAVGRRVYP